MIGIGTFDCNAKDIDSVAKAMESGFLSVGEEMRFFENKVSERHGKKFGVMVNSGQSALEVALILAKVKLKKEKLNVVIPSTTYAATLWAVLNTGCEPIFCDIGKDFNIDCNKIDTCDIDVFLVVDLCGKTAEIPQWVKDKYFIIEDACEAVGNKNCSYGDIVCMSFYVSHLITTGSGGMLCLDDKDLYEYANSYICHGRQFGGDFTKFKDKWVDRFLFDKVGVSYRSDNMSAALGLSQFSRIDSIIGKRKANAKILIDEYMKIKKLRKYFYFPSYDYLENSVFQFFPILINENSGIKRDKLLNYLFENGVDSRVLLPITNQSIVVDMYGHIEEDYPFSEFVNSNGFIVGCHQNLNEIDMKYIIQILENYFYKSKTGEISNE